jgi:predicted nucleic acid-binding protein
VTAVLVDTNVLIDVLGEDTNWTEWSAAALERAGDTARLVINPVIYCEVSVQYSSIEALAEALPTTAFEREPLPFEAAFLAGKAYLAYRRRGGTKQSLLPDFLIGAHAAIAGYRLLTRDATRYRTYFPRLDLIAPAT